MGFGIVWVLYFVYLTWNIGVSPPQPLEPGSVKHLFTGRVAEIGPIAGGAFLQRDFGRIDGLVVFLWGDLIFEWVAFAKIPSGEFSSGFLEPKMARTLQNIWSWMTDLMCLVVSGPILKATEDMEVLTACDSLGGNGGYLGGEKAPKIPMSLDSETKNWWFVDVFPFPKWAFSGSSRSFGM